MGTAWSASSTTEELPRNENGKRLRPWESTSSSDGEVPRESSSSSYQTSTILNSSSQSQQCGVALVRQEEIITRRRTKRQRVEDYHPQQVKTTTYSLRHVGSYQPLPFWARTLYTLTGKISVMLTQSYMSLAEYSMQMTSSESQTDEILHSVSEMLDNFQSLEPDVLSRGWRILCACSMIQSNGPRRQEPDNNIALDQDMPENDIGMVVTGMRLHSDSLRLQLLGCRALKILLDNDRGTWEELVQEGFVQVMMNAMKSFPHDLVLQGLMMSFLGMVITEHNHNNNNEEESLTRELLGLGIIEVVLAALEKFEEYPRLLHTGSLALLQMTASLQEARERVVAKNGHILVYRILKEHLQDELLLVVSLNTLSKLLSVQTIDGLPLQDVVQTVLKCMERFPHEESVQTHALVSILRLGERTRIPTEATLEKMIPAMTYFRHSKSFIFIACVVIRSLIANSTQPAEVLQLLLDTGGIECIVNAAKDHKSRHGIQQIVQLLLSVLLVHQHAAGVSAAFAGSLRVVGHMTSFENFDSDNEDDE